MMLACYCGHVVKWIKHDEWTEGPADYFMYLFFISIYVWIYCLFKLLHYVIKSPISAVQQLLRCVLILFTFFSILWMLQYMNALYKWPTPTSVFALVRWFCNSIMCPCAYFAVFLILFLNLLSFLPRVTLMHRLHPVYNRSKNKPKQVKPGLS